jgi:hypothetical protein
MMYEKYVIRASKEERIQNFAKLRIFRNILCGTKIRKEVKEFCDIRYREIKVEKMYNFCANDPLIQRRLPHLCSE